MANATVEDWQVLGLKPGAGERDVRRAYAEKRRLYGEDSLSSYMLLENHERRRILRRFDDAYAAILGETPEPDVSMRDDEVSVGATEPDRDSQPAEYLRYHRVRSALSVHRLAVETKIRPEMIEAIETGRVDRLPAAPYVRGFVSQIAQLLGLEDPQGLASTFLRIVGPAPTSVFGENRGR